MERTGGKTQTFCLLKENSTETLAEVLSFARQILENRYKIQRSNSIGNDLEKIEHLRRENELLKTKLSDLEKMIKEKL